MTELGSHQKSSARITVKQSINHDGEINRARYMPQKPDLIATKTVRGEVYVFDRTKHESKPSNSGGCRPDIKLTGQSKEGCVRHIERMLTLVQVWAELESRG